MLPYMTPERQMEFLGEAPDPTMVKVFSETLARGFAISRGDVLSGSTNIAAPIIELDGQPVGAVLISVPNDRGGVDEETRLGAKVLATAQRLSRGQAPKLLSRP
jgi:DNA-binding IclR family transcriptional regulator